MNKYWARLDGSLGRKADESFFEAVQSWINNSDGCLLVSTASSSPGALVVCLVIESTDHLTAAELAEEVVVAAIDHAARGEEIEWLHENVSVKQLATHASPSI